MIHSRRHTASGDHLDSAEIVFAVCHVPITAVHGRAECGSDSKSDEDGFTSSSLGCLPPAVCLCCVRTPKSASGQRYVETQDGKDPGRALAGTGATVVASL